MKAVIPCAKKEEDLFPFSETKPTALMPIMGKPLVKHTVKALEKEGIEEIYIVAKHMKKTFEEEFENNLNVEIVEQESLDGTASAINTCDFIEDDFIVINGDVTVSQNDIRGLLKKFRKTGETSILATDEESPEKFGVLSITNDEVKGVEEKPKKPENPLINTGIYVFKNTIFQTINKLDEDENSITDAVRKTIEKGGARYELIQDYWIDIGTCEKLWKADQIKRQHEITEKKISEDAEISDKAEITGNAVIEESVEIKAGAVIQESTFIGKNTVIEPNTTIKNSTITENTQLNQCSIENTLVFEENIIDSFTAVENSVIAEECDIKQGTIIRESMIGARSYVNVNNSIRGTKFVPDARTDLGEISK